MRTMTFDMSRVLFSLCAAFVALALACSGSGTSSNPEATRTPVPLPPPVEFADEPAGATRGDPSFEPLPDAQAHFGELGGSIYQIEIPDNWNGRLVLYMHGFANFAPMLFIQQPGIRGYLIQRGYAWGASSFSNNSLIPGTGADETAALWDLFVQQFGRPDYTYITGHSMGGGAVQLAAERYPQRFDGALSLCGIAGNTAQLAYLGDFFVAAAFVTGQTQADYDAMGAGPLIDNVILPALEDEEARDQLVGLITDLTGGPRPFVRQGILEQISMNLQFVGVAIGGGLYDNNDTIYTAGSGFNANVIRVTGGGLAEQFYANQDPTGELQLPLLTLHTTADLFVPIHQQQILRRLAEEAGTADLLVQRTVQASGHCSMLSEEWTRSLEDLIRWVEADEVPAGEDLLGDLSDVGAAFTLAARIGSAEADGVPGADARVTISGRLTMDGQPFQGALLGVVPRRDGLEAACSFTQFSPVVDGAYRVVVAGDAEVLGCGTPGDSFYLFAVSRGEFLSSQELGVWPEGTELTFDATFSSSDMGGIRLASTTFTGGLADASGEPLPPGTQLEAYIGEALCGRTSIPHTVMGANNPFVFFLSVAGPELVPECLAMAAITFRVDGDEIDQTATNDLGPEPHDLDLSIS